MRLPFAGMTGPLSGSNKPGEEDSWESLAEDLFGIDFHGGIAADDLPDDDEDLAPAAIVAEQNDTADEHELEAGFPEDDEADAGFPDEEAETDAEFSDVVEPTPTPAKAERSKAAPVAEEKDSFWDALNDWDWSEAPRPRKPSVPLTSIVEQHDDGDTVDSSSSSSETKNGGGERRRRRRGRRRSSVTEPVTASQETAPIPQKEPEPLPVLEEEFELAPGDEDDDEFGAGLLEPVRRPSRRPKARPEAERRPSRRESAEGGAQPPARGERSKQVEPPATRAAADEAGFGDDLDEGEQPPRRRRRRRRRSAESIEGGASSEKVVTPQPQEDEEPQQRSERPRRRSRPSTEPRGQDTQSSRDAVPRSGTNSGVVPTWAEAIALLVHRHPKQTSGWRPEPDDEDSERPSRPRSNGGRRRRRRPS